jgi:hypothetical protein
VGAPAEANDIGEAAAPVEAAVAASPAKSELEAPVSFGVLTEILDESVRGALAGRSDITGRAEESNRAKRQEGVSSAVGTEKNVGCMQTPHQAQLKLTLFGTIFETPPLF